MHEPDSTPRYLFDKSCISAYELAVQSGSFEEKEIASALDMDQETVTHLRERLINTKLLTPGARDGEYIPIEPEIARTLFSEPLRHEIHEREERVTHIYREFQSLSSIFQKNRHKSNREPSVRTINRSEDVNLELAATARRCRDEVLTMQPGGGRRSKVLKDAETRDIAMLERGVRMRILYQQAARSSQATRQYVRKVGSLGAIIRASDEIFDRLIIFDRMVAFIPQSSKEQVSKDNDPGGAIIVHEPILVSFLCRAFETFWVSSQPFETITKEPSANIDSLQKSILHLMALGLKDDVVARQLGMATRTCRRHVSVIMENLGVASRFQAGVRATELGLIQVDHAESDFVESELT